MEKNDVSSFFYYMWNMWSETEADIVFPDFAKTPNLPNHFWSKWCGYCKQYGPNRAIPSFYASLSEHYRDDLVKRATDMYDRGAYTPNHPNYKL